MLKETKVVIIGAGPAGLYFASLCEQKKVDYLVLEASDELGGQLTRLYPEKEIVDIPGITSIKAKEFVELLKSKLNQEKIILNTKVEKIENNCVFAGKITVKAQYVIIAIGLGFSSPRPLGVEHENECENILYSLKEFSFLKDKKVAIFGGGDSALDWTKEISKISDGVHLIHRRTEFRGDPKTIENCHNIAIHLPFVPDSIKVQNGIAKSVRIKEVVPIGTNPSFIDIPVDYILVNYGNQPSNSNFGFEQNGLFIKVNESCEIKTNIFAVGDICDYENKKRRIAPLIGECDKVFKIIES